MKDYNYKIAAAPIQVFEALYKLKKFKFILYNNNFRKTFWDFKLFDENTNNCFYFSNGISIFDPVRVAINYKLSGQGTGAVLVSRIDMDTIQEDNIEFFLKQLNTLTKDFKQQSKMVEEDYFSNFENFLEDNPFHTIDYFYIDTVDDHFATYSNWYGSKLSFTQYMQDKIGWQIDEGIEESLLGSIPPLLGINFFQVGEPYDFDKNGNDRYISFIFYDNKIFYQGLKTKEAMKDWVKVFEKLNTENKNDVK